MLAVRSRLVDPTADAAQLLCRLALIILMVLTPVAELFSFGALYVLLPIGAAILIISGWLIRGLRGRNLGDALLTPIGVTAFFLILWSGLSLAWTPFPAEAAARFGRSLATGLVVLLAIVFLPERTKASNLYLLPIGVAAAALATGALVMFGPPSFSSGPDPDHTLAQRCLVCTAVLVWPALGALALRERWLLAAALPVAVAAAAFADFFQIALASVALGAATYTVAATNPRRIAQLLALGSATLVLFAPILAFAAFSLADMLQLPHNGSALSLATTAIEQWPRLITGHGLGMAAKAIEIGALPPDAPRSILFTIWYELGFLGALSLAVLSAGIFVGAGHAPPHVSPALLAGLVAALIFALWGTATTQLWWITLNGLDAIAFALLFKGRPRAERPLAPAGDEAELRT